MSHYFENDKNLKSEEKNIIVKINNIDFKFIVDNGVFSKKGLDFGTRTLLETISKYDMVGNVLDLGCGYGPIGIFLRKEKNLNVDMVDINNRAINLSIKNAKLNNVDVNVFESNIYSNVNKKYDYIVTNPPIRVGKEILYKMLFDAKEHLNKNGELWIVINKNQGAKSLFEDLKKVYNTQIVEKNKGFYIIRAINN